MATDKDPVHPDIRRALGKADQLASKGDDHAARARRLLGKPRGKQPSRPDQQFDDPEENTLSMHLPGGTKISAKGVKAIVAAVLIALILALAAGLVFVGRITAPRGHGEVPSAPQKQ